MKHMTKAIILAALLALGVAAYAQGGGGGRQGGGRGQFGMMGRGGGGPSGIVGIPEVQTELGLDDATKTKLREFQDKQREEQRARMEEMRNSGGGGGGLDMEAMQKAMREQSEKNEKAIAEILGPDKYKRLREIWIFNQGNRALLNEQVQKDLGLSDDQKAAIKKLQDQQREAMAGMRDMDRDQRREAQTKQQEIMNTELGKIPTAEQAAKLKEMGGKPFKLPERGGGGL